MLVGSVELDVDPSDMVEPPRLVVNGLVRAGDVTIGLTPPLLSSVAPSGIVPTGATPGADPAVDPLKLVAEVVMVPDAVPPAPQDEAVDRPIVFVSIPALSKVEPDPVMLPMLPADVVVLVHGSLLAIGPSGIGLTPPGASSVAPSGIPTEPTDDVAPGTPSGEVVPMAGKAGVSGAIWAKLAVVLSRNSSDPAARIFRASSHCVLLRKSPSACTFAVGRVVTCKRRIDISVS
jgi:hypothetical protein